MQIELPKLYEFKCKESEAHALIMPSVLILLSLSLWKEEGNQREFCQTKLSMRISRASEFCECTHDLQAWALYEASLNLKERRERDKLASVILEESYYINISYILDSLNPQIPQRSY